MGNSLLRGSLNDSSNLVVEGYEVNPSDYYHSHMRNSSQPQVRHVMDLDPSSRGSGSPDRNKMYSNRRNIVVPAVELEAKRGSVPNPGQVAKSRKRMNKLIQGRNAHSTLDDYQDMDMKRETFGKRP